MGEWGLNAARAPSTVWLHRWGVRFSAWSLSDQKSIADPQRHRPAAGADARINHRHDHAIIGEVRPGAAQLEARVPDIARIDAVPKVQSDDTWRLAFEHRMEHADVVIREPEVGEKSNRTHGETLARIKFGIRNSEFGMPDTPAMLDARYSILDARYSMLDARSAHPPGEISVFEFRIFRPPACLLRREATVGVALLRRASSRGSRNVV